MAIKAKDLRKDEFYWIKLAGSDRLIIGKWHGLGFWVAGNDLQLFGEETIKILSHVPRPEDAGA